MDLKWSDPHYRLAVSGVLLEQLELVVARPRPRIHRPSCKRQATDKRTFSQSDSYATFDFWHCWVNSGQDCTGDRPSRTQSLPYEKSIGGKTIDKLLNNKLWWTASRMRVDFSQSSPLAGQAKINFEVQVLKRIGLCWPRTAPICTVICSTMPLLPSHSAPDLPKHYSSFNKWQLAK